MGKFRRFFTTPNSQNISLIPATAQTNRKEARTPPAQGRATFKMIVLRWRFIDGRYCPSPSPPGFPLYGGLRPRNRWGLLPSLPAVALVANPSSTAQRGRDGSLPLVVRRKVGKNAGLPASVFSLPGGLLPPRQ